ncbi:class I SAM-dependent methyltransferase [Ruania halotolerans]|uniref:class I SAM-dependent methyltransferase n=1 Tax=Ruania halotolerans TaxID=2897773 RepID=UPI001E41193A|nr:methyltransferase domain-containing protein [Ruania halotolerans]UFU06463.1 methyltransferase domain-containing protein [Ruania halotolerans]
MEPCEFWSTGDYATVGDLWSQPGRDLPARLNVQGKDVVDLATGTGVTAIAATRAGASSVIGVDVTPSLLAEAARRAAALPIRWVEADVTALPLPEDSADLVVSTFGLVFAEPVAAFGEARRIARPGGQVVATSWAAEGLFGRLRQVLAPFAPDAPLPWHEDAASIREVLGSSAQVRQASFVMTIGSPEHFVGLLEQHSAPIVMLSRAIGEEWPAARQALVDLMAESGTWQGDQFEVVVHYLITSLPVS